MGLPFIITDVFSDSPFNGAQISVIPNADKLDDYQMQMIANEFNTSETVFLSTSDDPLTKGISVFTPTEKTVSASHTILAASYVVAQDDSIKAQGAIQQLKFIESTKESDHHIVETFVNKNSEGQTTVQQSYQTKASVDRFTPATDELAKMLSLIAADISFDGFDPMIVACDHPYLIVPIKSYTAVRAAIFKIDAWSQSSAPSSLAQSILLFSNNTDLNNADFHLRLLGPNIGVNEDPPIAPSLSAFANYLCEHQHIQQGTHSFAVQRGGHKQRQSIIQLEMDNKAEKVLTLRIGGTAAISARGELSIPNM